MTAPRVSVVLPAYNEAQHIYSNIVETMTALAAMEVSYEIIVVDDGSPDGTDLEAARLLERYSDRVRVVRYAVNRGKGNAVMCGSWFSRGELIVFLDADMELHPHHIGRFMEVLDAERADVVIGSKFHPESKVNYPKDRRIFSTVYYGLVRLLFGLPVRDTQTGIKLFRRQVLEEVFPKILVKRFAFDIEVLANAHRLGYRISEAPVNVHFKRQFGRINWRDAFHVFVDTIAIFYRMYIRRYYDRTGFKRLSDTSFGYIVHEVQTSDVA